MMILLFPDIVMLGAFQTLVFMAFIEQRTGSRLRLVAWEAVAEALVKIVSLSSFSAIVKRWIQEAHTIIET